MGLIIAKKCFLNANFQYVVDIDFQLDAFLEYINMTQKTIEKEVKAILLKYDQLAEKANEDELFFDPQDYEIRKNIAVLYYSSIFITLYSFLERKLYQLYKIAEINCNKQLKISNDKGILKYINYFKNILKLDITKLNGEISYFLKLGELRNKIIHDTIDDIEKTPKNKKVISTFKSIKYLTFKENKNSVVFSIDDDRLLKYFCRQISSFLDKLYHE